MCRSITKKTVDNAQTLRYIISCPLNQSADGNYAIVVQLVVRHLAKVEVASSSLVYRSCESKDSLQAENSTCLAGKINMR